MDPDYGLAPAGEGTPHGEWAPHGEWECMECGYIEAGVKSQPPKVCPECNAPAQALEFFPDEEDRDVPPADEQDIFEDEDKGLR